jgi:hypothetical protein
MIEQELINLGFEYISDEKSKSGIPFYKLIIGGETIRAVKFNDGLISLSINGCRIHQGYSIKSIYQKVGNILINEIRSIKLKKILDEKNI